MLQLSIALLFALAGMASVAVVGQTLRRAWRAAGELRAALAECEDIAPAMLRSYAIERCAAPMRVIRSERPRRTAAPRALLAAA